MAQIEINNTEIELGTNRIVLNKESFSVENWESKKIDFSESLTVPRINFMKFNTLYDFKYKENGSIVFIGIAILLSETKTESEIILLDNSISLFDSMNENLNKLELDSQDFVFNLTEYAAKKVLNSSIWLWSAANNHTEKILSKNILSNNLAFSRPFFSCKRLLELIFDVKKWTFETSLKSELLNKLIISSNHETFYFTSYEKTFNETIVNTGLSLIELDSYSFIKTDSIISTYTLSLNYKTNIRFRGYITSDSEQILQIVATSSAATNSETQNFTINKGRNYYDLTSNEFETIDSTYDLDFNFIGSGSLILEDFRIYTLINEIDFGTMSLANFTDYLVKTYDNIPNISQKDLFKNCLAQIAGVFKTDSLRKKIKINSLGELSKLSSLDWSNKFIENSEKKVSLDSFGKNNYFNYNNKENSSLGRGLFTIENDTLINSKIVFSSIFGACSEVLINTNSISDFAVYNDTERINTFNCIISYYENVAAYSIARFNLLNGNNILIDYYKNITQAVQNGEILEVEIILNNSDFFNFDFTRTIYIKSLKATFYILKINNYIHNTQCELIMLRL